MEKYHIGQEILKEVKAKFPSVAAFARELCKSSSATYEILLTRIKIQHLILISSVLLNILIQLPHLLGYGEHDGAAFLVGLGWGVDVVRLVVGSKSNHVLSSPAFPHKFS